MPIEAIDDIPTPLKTKFGDMISVPYGLDLSDSVIYAIEKHSMPEMKLRIEQAIRTFEREITESSDNRASMPAGDPYPSLFP